MPLNEEEADVDRIIIRKEYYSAVAEGYLSQMKDELSNNEIEHFHYAGEFAIYMQALRFLTDYLNDDIYYGCTYENQNYNRAKNQIVLLKEFQAFQNHVL